MLYFFDYLVKKGVKMGKTSVKPEPYLTELEPYLIEAENQYKASPYFAIRADYYEARQSCEIDDHMILYEAFYGRGITCNPGALFRYLLSGGSLFRLHTCVGLGRKCGSGQNHCRVRRQSKCSLC